MTNGQINVTELVAALICEKESIVEGIKYVQDVVDGSMTMLVMTKEESMVQGTGMGEHLL